MNVSSTTYPLVPLLCAMATVTSCAQDPSDEKESTITQDDAGARSGPSEQASRSINAEGMTIAERFSCPDGAQRLEVDEDSFAWYLRHLPLKSDGSRVHYYDGREKDPGKVYAAVVDMELDAQDLQQCADAVMRLRGEYLFHADRKSEIHFDFISDGEPRYFTEYAKGDMSYARFRKYMKYIFSYANTASLREELDVRPMNEMQIGDVFIQKGRPFGHAVIVVDMCADRASDERYYMLAQSYMPAQDTQILLDPGRSDRGVWYKCCEEVIRTPEWTFSSGDLRRF